MEFRLVYSYKFVHYCSNLIGTNNYIKILGLLRCINMCISTVLYFLNRIKLGGGLVTIPH